MKDIRAAIIKHKKTVCILGLIFVIFLECCVFPVGSITHTKWFTIGIINFITAVGICKCVGETEAVLFPKATWIMISLLNIGITIMGMVSRYFLEYGEVSNTYNFTPKKIAIHMIIMILLSTVFWMQSKSSAEF